MRRTRASIAAAAGSLAAVILLALPTFSIGGGLTDLVTTVTQPVQQLTQQITAAVPQPVGGAVQGVVDTTSQVTQQVASTVDQAIAPTSSPTSTSGSGAAAPTPSSSTQQTQQLSTGATPRGSSPSTTSASDPRDTASSGASTGYQAPEHGTNPHGQGTVAAIDLQPSNTVPAPADPTGKDSGEEIVLGRSRGECNQFDPTTGICSGSYQGHITILSLFGNEVLGVNTTGNETKAGPLDPIQTNVLDALCTGSGGQVCVDVLRADSKTGSDPNGDGGSLNHFRLLGLALGGSSGLNLLVGDSNGNLLQANGCQRAHGDSTLVKLSGAGSPILDLGESHSDSQSAGCPGGAQTSGGSTPLALGGRDLCGDPSSQQTTGIPTLLPILCHVSDATKAASCTAGAFNVQESAVIFLLQMMDLSSIAKITPGASESQAGPCGQIARTNGPTGASGPTGPANNNQNGATGPSGAAGPTTQQGETPATTTPENAGGEVNAGNEQAGGVAGENAANAAPAQEVTKLRGQLPFTGADVLFLGLLGMIFVACGLWLRRADALFE